jgi:hypothetical protein
VIFGVIFFKGTHTNYRHAQKDIKPLARWLKKTVGK